MSASEIARPRPAAASAGDRTVAGCPGVRRLEFSTTDPLQAQEFLEQAYGWRLHMTGARSLRDALTVIRVDTGSFAVSDVTLPADVTFEVIGRDVLIVSTIIEGTALVDRAGGTDRYRPGEVLVANSPGTRYVCQAHGFRGRNFALPMSLLYAVAGLERTPFAPLWFLSPNPASPAGRIQWRDTCEYVDSLLATSGDASPLIIASAARLLAATALNVFAGTATDAQILPG